MKFKTPAYFGEEGKEGVLEKKESSSHTPEVEAEVEGKGQRQRHSTSSPYCRPSSLLYLPQNGETHISLPFSDFVSYCNYCVVIVILLFLAL